MEFTRIIEIGIAFLVMIGGLLAYSESKFAAKEQTRSDIQRIEVKIDQIYNLLIQGRGK